MTTSQTRATTVTPEELGYLIGGPGRATETAIAGLLDAGRIRISREGVITVVSGHWNPTPLQAQVMSGHHGHIGVVAKAVAFSPAADALREHLAGRGLVNRKRGGKLHTALWTFALLIVGAGFVFEANDVVPFVGVSIALVVLAQLFFRPKKPLTSAGRRIVRKAVPRDRVEAVAVHGLRGKINRRPVAGLFELPEDVVGQLPTRSTKNRSSDSSSCGSGCGSSSCSSGSSCGGSSGCGGGSCGGGGGD